MGGEFRHLSGNSSVKTSGELGWWLDLAFSETRKIVPRLCAAADLTENENLIAGRVRRISGKLSFNKRWDKSMSEGQPEECCQFLHSTRQKSAIYGQT